MASSHPCLPPPPVPSLCLGSKVGSVAKGVSLRAKELVEPGFHATMDCDDEAAFGLVYHYSVSWLLVLVLGWPTPGDGLG